MLVIARTALRVTQLHAVLLDGQTHHIQMRHALLHAFAGKQQGEFLTAVTVGLAATTDLAQLAGDQAQHLIAYVMTMGVVDFLK